MLGHLNSLPYLSSNINEYNLLPDVSKNCWMSECRPWWDAVFYGVSSGSIVCSSLSVRIHTVKMVLTFSWFGHKVSSSCPWIEGNELHSLSFYMPFVYLPYTCNGRPRWLSWMRRPTGDQEVAGSTPAEVSNILSWRLIMKYFLRSFSPFRWFKKGSCQFLAKECAQYWLTA